MSVCSPSMLAPVRPVASQGSVEAEAHTVLDQLVQERFALMLVRLTRSAVHTRELGMQADFHAHKVEAATQAFEDLGWSSPDKVPEAFKAEATKRMSQIFGGACYGPLADYIQPIKFLAERCGFDALQLPTATLYYSKRRWSELCKVLSCMDWIKQLSLTHTRDQSLDALKANKALRIQAKLRELDWLF